MTIRMLNAWSGYDNGEIVSGLASPEEQRLIGLGLARAYPTSDDVNEPRLTSAQVAAVAAATPDGAAFVISEVTPYVTRTTTGQAFTGACELAGFDVIVAAGNITIYDNTSATGTVIVPTTALTLGRTEFLYKRALTLGCHVVLSGAATVNVLVG